jgi:6-phosphogluconolactonase
MKDTLVYVGTYTGTKSDGKGIYVYRYQAEDQQTGQNASLVAMGLAAETDNPAFLHIDQQRRIVFAVNEISTFQGQPAGAVSAFSVDPLTGRLRLINQKSTMGSGPCQLVLDKTGRHILVANYGAGSVAVLPVAADGTLGDATDLVQHRGSSVNRQRQKGPHAHCVTLDPQNVFAYVCDLGMDKVMIYRFDSQRGKLTPDDPPFVAVKPGAGPRQMVFRPDGRFAYVVNEMDSTVTAFSCDSATGALQQVEIASTLPDSFAGSNTASGIGMHPSGTYLFVSNRGHETIVLYEIDPGSGRLRWVDAQQTAGKTPRHFGIHPSGSHLAVVNQSSDTVVIRAIDPVSGRLNPSSASAGCPTPTCAVFLTPP